MTEEDKSKTPGDNGSGRGRSFGKWRKVKKDPKLEKVTEENSNDFFGVKSYLHHFYDTIHTYKDPDVYEDDDLKLLLKENATRRRRCISSIWWKVFVWIGANLLIFGIVGVLVGYLVPQKTVIVAETEDDYDILDNQAINFNMNLDVCKLVGLILFCIGGLTLTVALLVPTIVVPRQEPPPPDLDTTLTSFSDYQDQPRSPPPVPVDSLTTVKQVQPARKEQESVATQAAGMVPLAASVTQ